MRTQSLHAVLTSFVQNTFYLKYFILFCPVVKGFYFVERYSNCACLCVSLKYTTQKQRLKMPSSFTVIRAVSVHCPSVRMGQHWRYRRRTCTRTARWRISLKTPYTSGWFQIRKRNRSRDLYGQDLLPGQMLM